MELDRIELDEPSSIENKIPLLAQDLPLTTDPVIEDAVQAIQQTEHPTPRDQIENSVSTELPANAEKINQTARRTFPDPAKEGLMAAIRREEIASSQIVAQEKKANIYMQKIDKLLDLTAELSALPDTDKVDFTDKIRTILADLKAQGTDLWKDENTVNLAREKVLELKSLISTHTDKARTEQQLVLTKMQSLAQDLMAILESAKGIHREDSRGKSTMIRNQRVSA